MSLPGRLCVGILEEDNPLRSYFRFKPLLIEENGRYIPFDEHDRYPDDGCIRIVPDKNEAYYFKSRMRQNGLFSVVDLRNHPNESDKIRPNKNYRPDGEENNANIIYSDVVRAPVADMIYQLLPPQALQGSVSVPHTPKVLIRQENGINPACYEWHKEDEEAQMAILRPTEETLMVNDFQAFDVQGFHGENISFLIKPAALMDRVCDLPEVRQEEAHTEFPKAETEPEEKYAVKSPTQAEAQDAEDVHKASEKSEAKEPPHRMSRSEQLRAAQVGLNPRRGRSLQELIDEKWQHSRLTQLGLPPVATLSPVQNPVDAAVGVVRSVWENPNTRDQLVEALSKVNDFDEMVKKRRELACQSALADELNNLEAQRLELLSEIDHLKLKDKQVREQLKQEIRADEAAEFREAVEKTRAARAQLSQYEQQVADMRKAAADAQGLLNQLVGEELENKIRDVALTQRVQERLMLLQGSAKDAPVPVSPQNIGFEAFIERVHRRLSPWKWSYADAANLCVCFALSPVLWLSGAPGQGKSAVARVLAEALGTPGAGRHFRFSPGRHPLNEDAAIKGLNHFSDLSATLFLDDVNFAPAPDILRGLKQCIQPEWRIVASLQDSHSGAPLNANALDQGFMVRVSLSPELPWQPAAPEALEDESLVSIEALRQALPAADVPERLISRMDGLRKALSESGAEISRRALDDAWRYCSTMIALCGEDADPDTLFDRAFAQRILPAILASAPLRAFSTLQRFVTDMPLCKHWMKQPLPIQI